MHYWHCIAFLKYTYARLRFFVYVYGNQRKFFEIATKFGKRMRKRDVTNTNHFHVTVSLDVKAHFFRIAVSF